MSEAWRSCSGCKGAIGFSQPYWRCTVSTCNRPRRELVFCSMDCWDAHVGIAGHRDAGAEEDMSPKDADAVQSAAPNRRRVVVGSKSGNSSAPRTGGQSDVDDQDILVVVSKLKAYVKSKSGLNTSAKVMELLSDQLRRACDAACARARAEGRQTLLDRDFED